MNKVLIGLTTITNWRGKTEEIFRYGIKEASLFPTFLKTKEREELYKILEKSPIKRIPHVHLRGDMELEELEYLIKRYHTKVFNIHADGGEYPYKLDYSKYIKMIYVENSDKVPSWKELKEYRGVCIDFSHWENGVLKNDRQYFDFEEKVKKFKIGCCHISAIKKELTKELDVEIKRRMSYSSHLLKDYHELDYIKKYKKFLPRFISIELENPLREQLKIKKYLEKII